MGLFTFNPTVNDGLADFLNRLPVSRSGDIGGQSATFLGLASDGMGIYKGTNGVLYLEDANGAFQELSGKGMDLYLSMHPEVRDVDTPASRHPEVQGTDARAASSSWEDSLIDLGNGTFRGSDGHIYYKDHGRWVGQANPGVVTHPQPHQRPSGSGGSTGGSTGGLNIPGLPFIPGGNVSGLGNLAALGSLQNGQYDKLLKSAGVKLPNGGLSGMINKSIGKTGALALSGLAAIGSAAAIYQMLSNGIKFDPQSLIQMYAAGAQMFQSLLALGLNPTLAIAVIAFIIIAAIFNLFGGKKVDRGISEEGQQLQQGLSYMPSHTNVSNMGALAAGTMLTLGSIIGTPNMPSITSTSIRVPETNAVSMTRVAEASFNTVKGKDGQNHVALTIVSPTSDANTIQSTRILDNPGVTGVNPDQYVSFFKTDPQTGRAVANKDAFIALGVSKSALEAMKKNNNLTAAQRARLLTQVSALDKQGAIR